MGVSIVMVHGRDVLHVVHEGQRSHFFLMTMSITILICSSVNMIRTLSTDKSWSFDGYKVRGQGHGPGDSSDILQLWTRSSRTLRRYLVLSGDTTQEIMDLVCLELYPKILTFS